MAVVVDGSSLTLDQLARIAASPGVGVSLDEAGLERVRRARDRVLQALGKGEQVYGLTTGLGSRATETLTAAEAADFSLKTLRGRAHAIGTPLSRTQVRAAMAVRLNTLMKGAAGADASVPEILCECLNRGLTPVVGSVGSIGAGDLCQGAVLGLALCGEGRMTDARGRTMDAAKALSAAGLAPLSPGPRDGLALANHSGFSAAAMALAVHGAGRLLGAAQGAAAMTMDAFAASTTTLDALVDVLYPQPGQSRAAGDLRRLLAGSRIVDPANARRLQDPLSIRTLPQVHGAAFAALDFAKEAACAEINSASDNPVVDLAGDRIISCGAFHTPLLTVAAHALSQALVQLSQAQLARMSKLLSERFSGLPQYLAAPGLDANGFAPLMKVAESVVAELGHAAMPVPVWPSVNADGVEDIQSNAPAAVKGLQGVVELGWKLCAMEMMVADRAAELRGDPTSAPLLAELHDRVRKVVEPAAAERPLGDAIDALADRIAGGICEDL